MLIAGTFADLDWLSRYVSASAYLAWHRTWIHSILFAILVSVALSVVFSRSKENARSGVSIFSLLVPVTAAALLHILLDAFQPQGALLFWPFRSDRIALDWIPHLDPWILGLLIISIAFPELLRLVSSEIGAKSKAPRGRVGAITGFSFVLLYLLARIWLHGTALSLLPPRTYGGESPRRLAALPQSLSLFQWDGIVETDSAIRLLPVEPLRGNLFDPERGLTIQKPEASPELDAARGDGMAKFFVARSRFPHAALERTLSGYEVTLRDLLYLQETQTQLHVKCTVELNRTNQVVENEIGWDVNRNAN